MKKLREIDECIDSIKSYAQGDHLNCDILFNLVDECILKYPNSSKLYCLRGDLIQLFSDDRFSFDDALHSYQKAVELDNNSAEAYEELGYLYYSIYDNYRNAEEAFIRSLHIRPSENSYIGLAQSLLELGRDKREVVMILEASPYAKSEKIKKILTDIMNTI